MQRITITIDDDLLEAVDTMTTARGYTSRSEAFRDIVRDMVDRNRAEDPDTPCIATLTYVYDHATRDLASRVAHAHHDHHDMSVATLHVHLDHDACLETAVLRGPAGKVRAFADGLATQRGVRHTSLHLVPVTESGRGHTHDGHGHAHTHVHA